MTSCANWPPVISAAGPVPTHLQATALVHEAYVRLADQTIISMEHRAQFFGLAAKVMRDILVDHARKRSGYKTRRRPIAFVPEPG